MRIDTQMYFDESAGFLSELWNLQTPAALPGGGRQLRFPQESGSAVDHWPTLVDSAAVRWKDRVPQ
jgi:hypothetical protein